MSGEGGHLAYLGLGSNLGDRRENLLVALRMLHSLPDVSVLRVSSVYESEPWGVTDQPRFLNLVALVSTERDPRGLLAACQEVERAMGRVRRRRWGPRVIDVDILLYDDVRRDEEDLVIPHPRMEERDFVMVPLRELKESLRSPRRNVRGEEGKTPGLRLVGRVEEEEWHG